MIWMGLKFSMRSQVRVKKGIEVCSGFDGGWKRRRGRGEGGMSRPPAKRPRCLPPPPNYNRVNALVDLAFRSM